MNWILSLDTEIFFWINHLPHIGLIDSFALFLSGIGEAGIIWFVIGAFIVFREEVKDHTLFVPLGIAAGFAWSISELILKPLVGRLRPSSVLDAATVIGGFPIGYSFPSTHATFAFAMASVLAYREPKWKKMLFFLAFLIALSRVYLGHHYPTDVITGGLLGRGIGELIAQWYGHLRQSEVKQRQKRNRKHNKIARKRTPRIHE